MHQKFRDKLQKEKQTMKMIQMKIHQGRFQIYIVKICPRMQKDI